MADQETITITMTLKQAQITAYALDCYARLNLGQFEQINDLFLGKKYNRQESRQTLNQLKQIIFPELRENESYGIYQKESPNAQIAWDIYQVIRHDLSWHRNPAGGIQTNYDTPYPTSQEPLVTTKIKKGK